MRCCTFSTALETTLGIGWLLHWMHAPQRHCRVMSFRQPLSHPVSLTCDASRSWMDSLVPVFMRHRWQARWPLPHGGVSCHRSDNHENLAASTTGCRQSEAQGRPEETLCVPMVHISGGAGTCISLCYPQGSQRVWGHPTLCESWDPYDAPPVHN